MDNLLQIKRTELNIGLKREYKFFQISDAHMACLDAKYDKRKIPLLPVRREGRQ